MNILDAAETLIAEYAKKIYGFAYSKTHNYHDAEDLSQNILLALLTVDFSSKQISDMDAYIYRVCQYTWSNFVRKNKLHWESFGYMDELETVADECGVEDRLIRQEMYQKLRREIAYLGENKRKVMILFYFENKSGKEISEMLGIPAPTVRWYLGQSKKRLKERLEMRESTIYTPKKLTVYFCGTASDFSLAGLRNDLLVQNICIVCQKNPLTIEEIAEKLCMSAAFIEDKLGGLLYMNYLEKVGTSKYRTTFFVQDADFYLAKKRFELEYIPPVADAIYAAVKKNLPKIREIGFSGCDLDENFLLWTFTTIAAHDYENKNAVPVGKNPPIRGDGGRHFINASWQEEDIAVGISSSDLTLADYVRYSGGSAGKHTGNESISMLQFDPPIVTGGRGICSAHEIADLAWLHKIIREGIEPGEHDKEIIARLAERGLVAVKDGVPVILVPYFTAKEYEAFREIMDAILAEAEAEVGADLPRKYSAYIQKKLPDWLSGDEKAFHGSKFYQPNAYPYLLYRKGLLSMPGEDEARRICTVVFERQ